MVDYALIAQSLSTARAKIRSSRFSRRLPRRCSKTAIPTRLLPPFPRKYSLLQIFCPCGPAQKSGHIQKYSLVIIDEIADCVKADFIKNCWRTEGLRPLLRKRRQRRERYPVKMNKNPDAGNSRRPEKLKTIFLNNTEPSFRTRESDCKNMPSAPEVPGRESL